MKKHLSVLTAAALTCSLLCSTALAAGTHTVESGETMYKIADKHGVELEQLIAANPQVKNPDLIFPGDGTCQQQKNTPETFFFKEAAGFSSSI